jgi:hypothetical protein
MSCVRDYHADLGGCRKAEVAHSRCNAQQQHDARTQLDQHGVPSGRLREHGIM